MGRIAILVCAVVVVAGACTSTDESGSPDRAEAPASRAEDVPIESADPSPSPSPQNEEQVLATAVYHHPGVETADLRVDIVCLERDDSGMVTLNFLLTNEGPEDIFEMLLVEEGTATGDVAGIYFVDEVHRKKHLTVHDAAGDCLCSDWNSVQVGAELEMWAKFPAPPEDVAAMTVVIPRFKPFEDIPISQ